MLPSDILWSRTKKYLLFALLLLAVSFGTFLWASDAEVLEYFAGDYGAERDQVDTQHDLEHLQHLEYNLRNVRCPARAGLELRDYWDCLWRTSITVEGMKQHERFIAEGDREEKQTTPDKAEKEAAPVVDKDKRTAPSSSSNKTDRRSRRRKRSTNNWAYEVVNAIHKDLTEAIGGTGVVECQQTTIKPGVSFNEFLDCLREQSTKKVSFNTTFKPTTVPPIQNRYEDLELISLRPSDGSPVYGLTIDFDRLRNEEHLNNFDGADPYFVDHFSEYRYKYSPLTTSQEQPGWSYRNLFPPALWHTLDIENFFIPIKSETNLMKKVMKLADLAQSYPGLGEIAEQFPEIETPMNFRWTKDSGKSIYTRFLLPLLTRSDLAYYKEKKAIDPSETIKSEITVLGEIVSQVQKFTKATLPKIRTKTPETGIPFVETYREFIAHFYNVDLTELRKDLQQKEPTEKYPLNKFFEIIRQVLRKYVEPTILQMKCLRALLTYTAGRKVEDQTALMDIIVHKLLGDKGCEIGHHIEGAQVFKLTLESAVEVYYSYFHRKEARQRYSLPIYPIPFPICKHSDQSPINILTNKGRKSALRDYVFGDVAYSLRRFFMFFPLDGSTLLSVGLVDGERLDDSSVRLSGGPVKGQTLTFQYMNIKFSDNWKNSGSDHYIDGKGAPMELQMIFTISGSADAIKYWHVLARVQNQLFQFREKLVVIISVLVDVLDSEETVKNKINDERLRQDPYLFEPLAQGAYQFRKFRQMDTEEKYEHPRGYVSKDPAFRFIDYIPRKSSKFYTYRGSLAWPPCFGYVLWSVYEQRLYMSKRQFDQFAQIPAFGISDNNLAANNFRRLDDIIVESENEPKLTYDEKENLVRKRTVDRYILEGFHDVGLDGTENDSIELVDDEFYYHDHDDDEE